MIATPIDVQTARLSIWSTSTRRPPPPPPETKRPSNRKASTYNERHAQSNDGQPFRFLDLPPELRNGIYGHFLSSEDFNDTAMWQIEVREEHEIADDTYNFHIENRSMSAFLQTCNQVSLEARTIPFNCNYIHFHKARDMVEFIGQLNTDQLHAIHNIAIPFDNIETDPWSWGMLKLFPKLEVLRLIIKEDFFYDIKGYIQNRDDHMSRKTKDLKGLRKFEIVVDMDDATEEEKADVRCLECAWQSFVTQPGTTT